MALDEPPLDEQQWWMPGWFEDSFWKSLGGLNSNTALWYFSNSPYFDRMSSNAILWQQISHNRDHAHILYNKDLLEARMRTMSGSEFILTEHPADQGPDGTGVYVIRKQMRTKRPGQEDEVTVLNTYYIVENKIYMASLAADLLKKSMLSLVLSVNKFMAAAAPLPDFSPALGHRYMPPPSNRLKATEFKLSQGSKETTPLPDALPGAKKAPASTNTNASNYLDIKLLEESLNITLKYGDEYMDENPITGQPGDFHLSTTGRKEKDKLMIPAATKVSSSTSSLKPSAPPTPLKTDIPPARKGSKADKSPRTPGMPKPKRRKSSKVQSAGGISPS